MIQIKDRTKHNNKNHYNGKNKNLFITIHETGNRSKGANAEMHSRYIENGSSSTWHFTVDDKEIIQHFDLSVQCWHSGDSRGNGNLHSIGIEICINQDGNYLKAVENATKLVQYLMKLKNIPLNNIVQHNHWSGKNCPMYLRSGSWGINWNQFIGKVKNQTIKEETNLFRVQTGAFKDLKNAQSLADKLKKDGYETYIVSDELKPNSTVSKPKRSVKEMADMIERTTITGVANRAKYLGLSVAEYKPVQDELNRRYS